MSTVIGFIFFFWFFSAIFKSNKEVYTPIDLGRTLVIKGVTFTNNGNNYYVDSKEEYYYARAKRKSDNFESDWFFMGPINITKQEFFDGIKSSS